MKTPLILIFLCIFIQNTQAQTPPQGYVTLKGRQFYDGNGNPFYPLMMNYEMEYQYDNSLTNHWLNKYWEYGSDHDGFENSNGLAAQLEIISDLTIIRSMGFNMVRPEFTPTWDPVVKEFYLRGRTYGDPTVLHNLSSADARTYFDQPYSTNQAVLDYFAYMDWFIDQAGQNNMYTMLNGVLGDVTDPDAFIPYKEYLDLLGNHFKNNKWLAFYDIINEPLYVYKYAYSSPPGFMHLYDKMQACELIAEYYDAIKNPNADPNHLISGGNLVTEDVTLFDPSLLKLDFSQPHLYSESYTTYDNCNLTNRINRIKGSTYWFAKNIPMPWINGETGFPSSDDPQFPKCDDLVCLVAGSNADQQTYAEQILQNTRDSKGSGFVWWVFQDGAWPNHGNALNGYGLLTLETGVPKQAVTTFANYLDPNNNYQPPPASTTLPAEPDNYLDPYVNKQFNPNEIGAVTGRVLDENGNGVDNAWITAKNFLYVDPIYGTKCNWTNSYTDTDGFFKIIPLNSYDLINHRITYIRGSAMGAESFHAGINDGTQMVDPPDVTLKNVKFEYDAFEEHDVAVLDEKNFKGWNSLTIGNSKLEGESQLNAREEINLKDGFHATHTSEVHVFPAETFAVCEDYSNFQVHSARMAQNSNNSLFENVSKKIELNFSVNNFKLSVSPNPSIGIVTVKILNRSESHKSRLILKNSIGKNLHETSFFENDIQLDLSNFAKGFYFIEVVSNNSSVTTKLILN